MAHHHHEHGTHHHHSHEGYHHGAVSNIRAAFALNTFFALVEIVGGLYVNSLSILSNALHDLGDSLSLGLAWYFQNLSGKARDKDYSYGYGRFSLLGALINSIILTIGSLLILREAVPRLWHPEMSNANGMVLMSLLGIIVNTFAMLRLRTGNTLNERVVSLHFIEDILGWVAVLIGSIIYHFTHLLWIDTFLSILISAYILYNVIGSWQASLRILLQGIPGDLELGKLEASITALPGVSNVHDVHIWTLDGQYHILSLHVVVDNMVQMEQAESIKQQIRVLGKEAAIQHVTIEIETEDQDCGLQSH